MICVCAVSTIPAATRPESVGQLCKPVISSNTAVVVSAADPAMRHTLSICQQQNAATLAPAD